MLLVVIRKHLVAVYHNHLVGIMDYKLATIQVDTMVGIVEHNLVDLDLEDTEVVDLNLGDTVVVDLDYIIHMHLNLHKAIHRLYDPQSHHYYALLQQLPQQLTLQQ
jgi:DNA primase